MPIPAGVETVTVSSGEPMTLPDGTLATGRIRFTAPDLVVVPSANYTFGGATVVNLVNGAFSIGLVPQDATGIDPTGWTYKVEAELTNAPSWSTFITLTKAEPSVALSDIVQPSSTDPNFISSLLPLAGGTLTGALNLEYGSISSDVGHDLTLVASTGVMHQSGPITLASSTSVTIPAGLATIVDPSHNHLDPKIDTVAFGPATVEVTDLVSPVTYFLVDSTGAIIQNVGVPTRQQRREFAVLGRAVVIGGAVVNVVDSPILTAHPLATTLDLLSAIGDIRVSGIRAAVIPGGLTFSLTEGQIFNLGANNSADPNDPNVSPFFAQSPAQFRYATQTSIIDMTPRTAIDPTNYDVGGVVTAVGGGSGTTTIQRVHCFPGSQNVFIQFGQNLYSSLTAAINALAVGETAGFVTHPDAIGGGVRTAFIVVTRTATDLADTANARIAQATRFGDPGGA